MKLVLKWLARCTGLAMAAAMAQGTMPTGAHAQAYPSQDIRLICAFPPGSGADVLVRYFAESCVRSRTAR